MFLIARIGCAPLKITTEVCFNARRFELGIISNLFYGHLTSYAPLNVKRLCKLPMRLVLNLTYRNGSVFGSFSQIGGWHLLKTTFLKVLKKHMKR